MSGDTEDYRIVGILCFLPPYFYFAWCELRLRFITSVTRKRQNIRTHHTQSTNYTIGQLCVICETVRPVCFLFLLLMLFFDLIVPLHENSLRISGLSCATWKILQGICFNAYYILVFTFLFSKLLATAYSLNYYPMCSIGAIILGATVSFCVSVTFVGIEYSLAKRAGYEACSGLAKKSDIEIMGYWARNCTYIIVTTFVAILFYRVYRNMILNAKVIPMSVQNLAMRNIYACVIVILTDWSLSVLWFTIKILFIQEVFLRGDMFMNYLCMLYSHPTAVFFALPFFFSKARNAELTKSFDTSIKLGNPTNTLPSITTSTLEEQVANKFKSLHEQSTGGMEVVKVTVGGQEFIIASDNPFIEEFTYTSSSDESSPYQVV